MKKYLINWVTFVALAVWFSYPVQAQDSATLSPAIGHSKAPLFSIKEKIIFNLNTNFTDLWKHRAIANREVPEDIRDFEAPGRLAWTDSTGKHDLPVKVQLRGNTSQSASECPFPKMSLSFEKDQASGERVSKGTLFDGLNSIGIGTHCGGKPGSSLRFRRVWGGLSPHREALIYKVQEYLSIPGFQVLPASFRYIDSSTGRGPVEPQPSGFAVNQPMPGFFLEDIKTFVKQADGKEIRAADAPFPDSDKPYIFTSITDAPKDAQAAGSTIEPIDAKSIIRIMFFQALVGNRDWIIRISPDDLSASRGLWNMKVVEANGKWIVFPYDYDLAGWVKSENFFSGLPGLADGDFYKPADISQVVAELKQKRPGIEALVDELAREDRDGGNSIKEHIKAFYNALDRRFH